MKKKKKVELSEKQIKKFRPFESSDGNSGKWPQKNLGNSGSIPLAIVRSPNLKFSCGHHSQIYGGS